MALIPYLDSGDSITAERMNTLFQEFDRKLGLMLGNKSPLLFRPYGPGGPVGVADYTGGVQFYGAEEQWEGQVFFFLGFEPDISDETIEPLVMAGIDRPLSCIFHKNPNYVNYSHSPFEAAAANTAEYTGSPSRDETRKIIKLEPPDATFFSAIARPNIAAINPQAIDTRAPVVPSNSNGVSSGPNSLFRFSLECHKRDVNGVPWWVMEHPTTTSTPLMHRYTAQGLCPRMDWAQVELVFDGVTEYTFPANYNRFRFFRIHNFNQTSTLRITFVGTDSLTKHTITIQPMASRCVRRTAVDGTYTNGGRYFQRYMADDPRFFQPNEGYFFGEGRRGHATNNICYPDIISAYYIGGFGWGVEAENRTINGWVTDKSLFWNAKSTYCNASYPTGTPLASVEGGPEAIHAPPTGGGYYAGDPDDDATKLGDLIYHRGVIAKCNHVIPTEENTITVLASDKINYLTLPNGSRPIKATIVVKRLGVVIPSTEYSLQFCDGSPDVPDNIDLDVSPDTVNCFILTEGSTLMEDDVVVVTFEMVGATNSEEFEFRGFNTMVADFAQKSITVAPNGSNQLVFTGACDLMLKSSNLLINSPVQVPIGGTVYRPRVFSLRGDLSAACYIPNITNGIGYAKLFQLLNHTYNATRNGTTYGTYQQNILSPHQEQFLSMMSTTVGDLKALNVFGNSDLDGFNQSGPAVEFTDRIVKMTGFGAMLTFQRKQKLQDWVWPRNDASYTVLSSSGNRLVGGEELVSSQHIWLGFMGMNNGQLNSTAWASFNGSLEGNYAMAFTSPRVDMLYGKRVNNYTGLPDSAALFYSGSFAYRFFNPDWRHTAFGSDNDDDKQRRVKIRRLTGFALLDRYVRPAGDSYWLEEDKLQIVSAHWQNNLPFNHKEQTSGGVVDWSEDFSIPNDWYRTNRGDLLSGTKQEYLAMIRPFARMPMLIDHYNNYASLVNSIVSVREYGFMEFYGNYFSHVPIVADEEASGVPSGLAAVGVVQQGQGQATEGYVYYSDIFPEDQYRRNFFGGITGDVEDFDEAGYFDKLITAKAIPLKELPASYEDVLVDTQRKMKGVSDFGSLIESQSVAVCLFGNLGFYFVDQVNGLGEENPRLLSATDTLLYNEQATYRYVSISDFKTAAESTGFKFRFLRKVVPLKLEAKTMTWSVIHGAHTETASEHVDSDLRFAIFTGNQGGWAIQIDRALVTQPAWKRWDIFMPTVHYSIGGGFPPTITPSHANGFTFGIEADKWVKHSGLYQIGGVIYSALPSIPFVIPSTPSAVNAVPLPVNGYTGQGDMDNTTVMFPDGLVKSITVQVEGMDEQVVVLKSGSWNYTENFSLVNITNANSRFRNGYNVMTSSWLNTDPAKAYRHVVHVTDTVDV